MIELRSQGRMWAAAMLMAGLLAGCASGPRAPAPVEDRSPGARSQPSAPVGEPPVVAEPVKPLPGAENVGKPGYYTVRPGDTLIRIALDSGQNWRDVARWNNVENPNIIEVGQVLRVIPPVGAATEVAVARPVTPGSAVPSSGAPAASASASRAAPAAPAAPVASLPPVSPTPAPAGEEDVPWAWPTSGAA